MKSKPPEYNKMYNVLMSDSFVYTVSCGDRQKQK